MRERLEERLGGLARFAARHQGVFWALHSLWALGWGIAFVVVGRDRPQLLRFGLVSVGAVWLTSLALPALLAGSLDPRGAEGGRAAARPLGAEVAPPGARVLPPPALPPERDVLLAPGPLHGAPRRGRARRDDRRRLRRGRHAETAPPRRVPRVRRLRDREHHAPDGLAGRRPLEPGGERRPRDGRLRLASSRRAATGRPAAPRSGSALVALFFLALVTLGRPAVPPAPLRLVSVRFGTSLAENGRDVASPLASLPAGVPVRLVAVAAIQAPAGLQEGVRHVWCVDGAGPLREPPDRDHRWPGPGVPLPVGRVPPRAPPAASASRAARCASSTGQSRRTPASSSGHRAGAGVRS